MEFMVNSRKKYLLMVVKRGVVKPKTYSFNANTVSQKLYWEESDSIILREYFLLINIHVILFKTLFFQILRSIYFPKAPLENEE